MHTYRSPYALSGIVLQSKSHSWTHIHRNYCLVPKRKDIARLT